MEFNSSQVREIDSVSLEQETCKKFDELQNLQTILKRLKDNLREKDKNYVKYKRFYQNIVLIIKNKLNNDSITKDKETFEEINYKLIDQNNIIINGEQLILSDPDHIDSFSNKSIISNIHKTITKENFIISNDYLDKEDIFIINNQKIIRLEENIFIPLDYYRKLYSHQKKGLCWLAKLHINNLGGILADDMGLGKTITILSLINSLLFSSGNRKYFIKKNNLNGYSYSNNNTNTNNYNNNKDNNKENILGDELIEVEEECRILIVCNVTLIEQWKNEINKWVFGDVKLYILHGNYDFERNYYNKKNSNNTTSNNTKNNNNNKDNNNKNKETQEEDEEDNKDQYEYMSLEKERKVNYTIYLIGYEYLRINIEYINNYEWYYLILDEGQKIRNPNSLITLAVKTIKTPHRIILSGSPIQNNLIELWSLIDFILPNYLGSLSSFIEDFVVPITSGVSGNERLNNKHINKLRALILPYIYRTLKPNNNKKDKNKKNKDKENINNKETQEEDEEDEEERETKERLGQEDLFNVIIGNGNNEGDEEEEGKEIIEVEDDYEEEEGYEEDNKNKEKRKEKDNESENEYKEDIELPNKIERIILCNLTMEQYKLYVSALNKYKYRDRYTSEGMLSKGARRAIGKELKNDKSILKLINTLRKICNHPKLLSYKAFPNNHMYNDNTEMPLEEELELYNEWINNNNKDEEEDEEGEEEGDNTDNNTNKNKENNNNKNKENNNKDKDNKKENKKNKVNLYKIKYKDTKSNSSSKLNVSMKIIDIWRRQGNKILLFTQTISMSMIIYEELIKRYNKKEIEVLNGKISISNRNKIIDRFTNDNRAFIMLLTTKVGGVGLNLTVATRIIIYDPDWNPMTDLQARERSYRIGQKKDVIIYRLITANTIEEKIYQRQLYKCYLTQKILNNYQLSFFNKYINNLQYLLSYPPPPYISSSNKENDDNKEKRKENEEEENKEKDDITIMNRKKRLLEEENTKETNTNNKEKEKEIYEDETYKMLIKNDENRNINSYIKYNDIVSYNNNTSSANFNYSSFFMKGYKSNRMGGDSNIGRQVDRSRELLNNLKSKGNKNIKYIITNKLLYYFNQNKDKEINTNNLINYFKPIIPEEYYKLFKSILKDLCVLIKNEDSSYWKLRSKYSSILPR